MNDSSHDPATGLDAPGPGIARRTVLLGLAVGATAVGPGGRALASGAGTAAAPAVTRWSRSTSTNGWAVLMAGSPDLTSVVIEGTAVTTVLRSGAVAAVLTHVIRRLSYEIIALSSGEVTGHTTDRRVMTPAESTYLSGTGVAVRPGFFPVGARDGLLPGELAVVRDVLAECAGVVRWGGDDAVPKESHFQIDVDARDPALAQLAATLGDGRTPGSHGAGAPPDVFAPGRRAAASALAARQRRGT